VLTAATASKAAMMRANGEVTLAHRSSASQLLSQSRTLRHAPVDARGMENICPPRQLDHPRREHHDISSPKRT
jgi:hypothetical protein